MRYSFFIIILFLLINCGGSSPQASGQEEDQNPPKADQSNEGDTQKNSDNPDDNTTEKGPSPSSDVTPIEFLAGIYRANSESLNCKKPAILEPPRETCNGVEECKELFNLSNFDELFLSPLNIKSDLPNSIFWFNLYDATITAIVTQYNDAGEVIFSKTIAADEVPIYQITAINIQSQTWFGSCSGNSFELDGVLHFGCLKRGPPPIDRNHIPEEDISCEFDLIKD